MTQITNMQKQGKNFCRALKSKETLKTVGQVGEGKAFNYIKGT